MSALRLLTWNVLHPVHAVNWGEAAIAQFPDERDRVLRISARVVAAFDAGVEVVCLQEVSGDQLEDLRRAVKGRAAVFHHQAPRVPKLHRPGTLQLADPTEHLVVLAAGSAARLHREHSFEGDPGKGFLVVLLENGALVTNTHVTWGPPGEVQLAVLAKAARTAAGPAVVAGDFNAETDVVRAGLGEGFALADLTGLRFTRTATPKKAAHTIDHVAALRAVFAAAEVRDSDGLSDHNPVSVTLALD